MFGLGKPRSKFGKWIDKMGIKQLEIERKAKLSRGIVSKLCNDKDHEPTVRTQAKVSKALRDMGYDFDEEKFWG